MLFECESAPINVDSQSRVDLASYLTLDLTIEHGNLIVPVQEMPAFESENPQVPPIFKTSESKVNFIRIWKESGTGLRRLKSKLESLKSSELQSYQDLSNIIGLFLSRKQKHLDQSTVVNEIKLENTENSENLHDKVVPWGESFDDKVKRIREASPFGDIPGMSVKGLIAKSNDDVRQEVCCHWLLLFHS